MRRLTGISFDVEHTLVIYCRHSDGANYVAAAQYFVESNAWTALTVSQQESFEAVRHRIPADWFNDFSIDRDAAFERAWNAADRLWVSHLSLDTTLAEGVRRQYHRRELAPWGSAREDDVVGFFTSVVSFFFPSCADDGSPQIESMPSSPKDVALNRFVRFLVFSFYASELVYRAPLSAEAFASWASAPASDRIPLGIVSNTDVRCMKAVRLFEPYRRLFGSDDSEDGMNPMIVTATNCPKMKPSGTGILQLVDAAYGSLGPAVVEQVKPMWLHIGDDEAMDGGAASDAGVLYWRCPANSGVDFDVLVELLELRGDDLERRLEQLGVTRQRALCEGRQ